MNKQIEKIKLIQKKFKQQKLPASKIEYSAENYDDQGKLIGECLPNITTEYAEIGAYAQIIYIVFIIVTSSFNEKFFKAIINYKPQLYKFKDFKKNLYPKDNFEFSKFILDFQKEKWGQNQFNFDLDSSPQTIYDKYLELISIFNKYNIKVIDQLYFDER